MKTWRYKITTPEQLEWAWENDWPIACENGNTVIKITMPKDRKPHGGFGGFLNRNDSIHLVPKTAEELLDPIEQDINNWDKKLNLEGIESSRDTLWEVRKACCKGYIIPHLPEDIFPKEEL